MRSTPPHSLRRGELVGIRWVGLAGIVAAGLCLGCQRSGSHDRYIPAPAAAQAALTRALKAWQRGDAPGPIPGRSPAVHLTDSHRRPGQVLTAFEILGEVPGEAPRCYAVRLKYDEPRGEERVRFVVVGIDPLWVFRHEDYTMLAHWEHPMPETKSKTDVPAPAESGGK